MRVSAPQDTATERSVRLGRILVPTDFSPDATRALHWAVAMKDAFHAALTVLHVVDLDALAYMDSGGVLPLGGPQPTSLKLLERVRADAEHALSRLTESIPGVQPLLREGSPQETILEVVGELGIDLIVMGTRGRPGLARVAFGSVADHVVRNSRVPVLIVRKPEVP